MLNKYFEPILGDSEGQGSLACCSPWGHRVRHNLTTEQQTFITIFIFLYFTKRSLVKYRGIKIAVDIYSAFTIFWRLWWFR